MAISVLFSKATKMFAVWKSPSLPPLVLSEIIINKSDYQIISILLLASSDNVASPNKSPMMTLSPRRNFNQQPSATTPVDDQSSWRGTLSKQAASVIIPNWMIHSALAIFVVGVTMVLSVCAYCCIFGLYRINKYVSFICKVEGK